MKHLFTRYDALALAVVLAVALFCLRYSQAVEQAPGSPLGHMMDNFLRLSRLIG
ncbi:hypothetical protein SAMN02745704_01880 [Paucidesulfovibrio gracilis DSM 16080]|uniref:Uncharacterized protein n=1 Tax=Paucidesulfovibrio gracilis DSM 16080 TaxID=1121449 RepID=A0A1T4X7G0_9BACT|nr:hypothetical protein [Paucidesulfovibrio gracilis]SKA85532.1 hypothetical protein SAMN02745704_01880 [Paucidesulfovibrio gracilis DSM 16080]